VIARHGNVYLLSKERALYQSKYVTEAMRIFRTAEKGLKASELGTWQRRDLIDRRSLCPCLSSRGPRCP
jgi:hypothetical protein